MLRLALVVATLALAAPAIAGGTLPRTIGMYAPQSATSLPMLDSKLDVTVRGPIVETTVTQTFRNDSDQITEATYIFPLPEDAAVTAMMIDTGTRKIHAAIERRERAQQRYEDAVSAGIGAGLLEQERPDVFTQTVSAIPAHGTVAVTLRFDTTAHYADGTWELVLPLVVAPRYVPGSVNGRPTVGSGHAADTDRSPDASRVTPHASPGAGGKTEIAIAFQTAVDAVSSPSHDLAHTGPRYSIVDPKSDHDAIVRWRAKAPQDGWVEGDAGGGFAAVVVEAPPAGPHTDAARCTLLVDRAATTRGEGDLVERALVRALLGAMTAKDRVAAIGLDFRAPQDLQKALDEAWAKPGGAFDLARTLAAARPGGAPLVLVTDGLVSDDAAVIAAARKTGVAVHVVGFGPAPNRSLLVAIANATGGTVRFATVGDDLGALARDVVADVASPPQPLAVSWGTLAASDVVPATLPRIGAGQAALVVARVRHPVAANARARGDVFALGSIGTPTPAAGATTPHGALGRRWARMRLDELIAAGNPRTIEAHALANGLVSPYTAMVAIGDEVVLEGGIKHTRAVPVSLPAGMRWQDVKRETTLDTSSNVKQVDEEDTKVAKDSKKKSDKKAPAKPPEKAPEHKPKRPIGGEGYEPREDDDAPRKTKKAGDEDVRREKHAADTNGDEAGAATGGDVPRDFAPAPEPVATRQMAPSIDRGGSGDDDEDRSVESEVLASSERRVLRLSASLGGGLALENHQGHAVGMVTGRIELGRRTLVGVEGSLWAVDGAGAEGALLGTITRRGFLVPRLELGGGVGLHLGQRGAGPAVDVVLRVHTSLRHISVYLRYDGALLFHDSTRDGENTSTLGVEATF